MSTIPAELPSSGARSGSVTIFGRKVSTDALLIAGASVVGIIVLWQIAKPAQSSAAAAAPAAGLAGDGASFATPPIDFSQLASGAPGLSPVTPPPAVAVTEPVGLGPGFPSASAIWQALGNTSPTPGGSPADIEIGNLEWVALHPESRVTEQSMSGQGLWAALGNTGPVPFNADLLTVERGNVGYLAQTGQLTAQQLQFAQANHLI